MSYVPKIYKNAYAGLSPATWWLSLVMLINRSGTMVVPFMTLYMTQALHYNIAKAGTVMAIFGAGAICGGFLGGKLTDKFGFYNIQLSALLCGGVMFMVLGQMTDFAAICICTFVLAVLNESFRPANSAAIAQYSNEQNRTRCYSLNRLSINLGFALGSAAAQVHPALRCIHHLFSYFLFYEFLYLSLSAGHHHPRLVHHCSPYR
jgi:predicted MFS family arabinose efflux permease